MAPVPVKDLNCDGSSYMCHAALVSSPLDGWFLQLILTLCIVQDWGAGDWVAKWETAVFHSGIWVQNIEPNKSSALTVVSSWCAVQIEICLMYNKLFWKWKTSFLHGVSSLLDNLKDYLLGRQFIVLPGSANSRSAALYNAVTHTERSRTKLRRRIS